MLKSHPDKKLEDHLKGVKVWGEYFLEYSPNELVRKHSNKELLECFFLLHDIGKATKYFQNYINGEGTEQELKTHAHLSSLIFLKYTLEKGFLKEYEQSVKQMYMSIFKHHDKLSTLTDCIQKTLTQNELLQKQWDSINKAELKEVFLKIELDPFLTSYTFHQLIEGIKNIFMKWRKESRQKEGRIKESVVETLSFEPYLLGQNLYSLLLDADKSEVVLGSPTLLKRENLSISIRNFLGEQKKETTKINQMREEAFHEVEKQIDNLGTQRIYTLTLPTGMGKTLNSLNFAFQLKEKLEKEEGITYKMIYALPFMSIIDQTVEILEKILESHHISCDTQFLLKSHHLAELEWKDEKKEETLKSIQESKILMEGWNSQIIVTTFVQLFETLIGYKNSSQRKYHNFTNSILILDEIQSLPVKYYQVIRNLLLEFTKYSNSRCIVMTATQPKIFKEQETFPLCDSKKYYSRLERTTIFNEIEQEKTIEQFVEEFTYEENKTYLMVLNTIQATKNLYDALEKKFQNKKIVLLNTNFPPFVRKQIIQNIKEGKYDIVVSTPLIEAGVDIDLNIVYRDFCPIPSLLQSAGRAGREGKTKGEVHFVRWIEDKEKEYAQYIYDSIDLRQTKEVLKGKYEIPENLFMAMMKEYYEKIADPNTKSQDESKRLIKGLYLEKFSNRSPEENRLRYAEDFRLIEQESTSINVFIEIREEAERLWKQYESILQEEVENVWEKKARIENIRRKLAEYVVVVRLNKQALEKNFPPLINGYYYVEKQMLDRYYHQKYGFGKSDTIFL